MNDLTIPLRRSVAHIDRRRLPREEAMAAEIAEAVTVAVEIAGVLLGGNVTRERLELPGLLATAKASGEKANRALQLLEQLERPASDREIGQHLTVLLGCMTGSKADPDTFLRMLKIDVVAANPSFGALEAACRKLRRTKTFVPSIAEVLEALEEARGPLVVARRHLERLPQMIASARERAARYRQEEVDDRERRRARIRDDITAGRSLWDYDPEEVANVRSEMADQGLLGSDDRRASAEDAQAPEDLTFRQQRAADAGTS